jgi:hypothetical protein
MAQGLVFASFLLMLLFCLFPGNPRAYAACAPLKQTLMVNAHGSGYYDKPIVPLDMQNAIDQMQGLFVHEAKTGQSSKNSLQPASALDASLIRIYRHSDDTDGIYAQVIQALAVIPEMAKQIIYYHGVRIVIVPTLSDYDPSLAERFGRPRGWAQCAGFENLGGLFHIRSNSVLVAERFLPLRGKGLPVLNYHVFQTTLHETGHAYDRCRGKLSAGSEFRSAYSTDISEMTIAQKERLRYFLQEGDAGPAEVFASLFMGVTCQGAGRKQPRPDISAAFPRSFKIVQNLVEPERDPRAEG